MILKPPHYGAETPWHQDEAYWPEDVEPLSASAWLPLDVATVESGCLWCPGARHRDDIHPHDHITTTPPCMGVH